jgi:peptidoglycan-associated lipoprotein
MKWSLWLGIPGSMLSIACGSGTPQPPIAPSGPAQANSTAPSAGSDADKTSPTRSTIVISDEIKRACGITDAEAQFAFDSARVERGDYPVLEKLARCFKTGPLAGRAMKLVGHADPRGDQEYNLLLGGRRADNVKNFLREQGIKETQMASSSRGEMDAKGADEATWAEDRRVDVLLGR